MTTLANYTFSSLALSAKLHKLLDSLKKSNKGFDTHIEQALQVLEEDSPLRQEAKMEVLSALKRQFKELEHQYRDLVVTKAIPASSIESMEELLENIREQIKEKEIML